MAGFNAIHTYKVDSEQVQFFSYFLTQETSACLWKESEVEDRMMCVCACVCGNICAY